MENNQRINKIEDREIDAFVKYTYRQMLEDEFLQSEYGRKIKSLEKLGIGMTFEEAVDLYIEMAGIKTDKVGNVVLEDEYINEVYQGDLRIISKQIGYDITLFDSDKIEKIIENTDYAFGIVRNLNRENRIEENVFEKIEVNESKKPLKNICEELNIKPAKYAPLLKDFSQILKEKGIDEEQVTEYINKYENDTIDTFIESESDIYLLETISYLHLIKNGEIKLDYETEKQMFLDVAETFKNSKYYSRILDEDGNPSFEKAESFYQEFLQARNSADLTRKIAKYSTYDEIPDLETEKDIFVTILRAYKSNDQIQIQNGIDIAKNLDFNIITAGKISDRKLEKYGRKYFGKNFDADEIVHLSEFNDDTIQEHVDRIMRSILNLSPIPSIKTVDTLNEYKENQKSKEKITCSKKEEYVRSILNGKDLTTEEIFAIYCKFRSMEMNERRVFERGLEPLKFDARFVGNPQENGVASIIKKYIVENKDNFSEYLTEGEELEGKKIMDMLEAKKFSVGQQMDITSVFDEIRRQTKRIDKKEKEHFADIQELKNNIKKLANNKLSKEQKEEMFKKAKHLQKDDLLSTEIIEKLMEADPESFNKTFKKSNIEARVDDESFRAFIYGKVGVAFRKAFVVLPRRIFNKDARQDYMPGIDQRMIKKYERMQGKLSEMLVLGAVKTEEKDEKTTNLPAVKKESIFDKIRGIFSKKNKNIESSKEQQIKDYSEDDTEQENLASSSKKEGLTSEGKSDKRRNQEKSGLDYIKVEKTPVVENNQLDKQSGENQKHEQVGIETDEQELGE